MRTAALLACLAVPAAAQTAIDISGYPLGAHPANDYELAMQVMNGGDPLAGACIFYRGQFRYRVYLSANPEAVAQGEDALFGALSESVGRPINEYVGGAKDEWLAVLDCGLDFARTGDDPVTPRARHPEAWAAQVAGFQELRDMVAAQSAEDLRAQRDAAGLPNR